MMPIHHFRGVVAGGLQMCQETHRIQLGQRHALKIPVPSNRIGHDLAIPKIQVLPPQLRPQGLGGRPETALDFGTVVRIHVRGLVVKRSVDQGGFKVTEQEAVARGALLEAPHEATGEDIQEVRSQRTWAVRRVLLPSTGAGRLVGSWSHGVTLLVSIQVGLSALQNFIPSGRDRAKS